MQNVLLIQKQEKAAKNVVLIHASKLECGFHLSTTIQVIHIHTLDSGTFGKNIKRSP